MHNGPVYIVAPPPSCRATPLLIEPRHIEEEGPGMHRLELVGLTVWLPTRHERVYERDVWSLRFPDSRQQWGHVQKLHGGWALTVHAWRDDLAQSPVSLYVFCWRDGQPSPLQAEHRHPAIVAVSS